MSLNLIVICSDTFRADYLGCYGNDWIKTPYLDRLAEQGTVFTSCYGDGLPTIPARRVFFTGNSIIPSSERGSWEPLHEDAVTLPVVLGEADYTTGFIADTYHYFKPGQNFHQGFDSWRWIRGQEFDSWKSGPRQEFNPRDHMPDHLWNENYDAMMRQYMMNTQDWCREEDCFCAQTFLEAGRWLERNCAERPFMMWIDTFDPHEPWDAPARFQQMYHDDYPCERLLFGYGVRNEDIREDDIPVLRALYAAEVTFVDMWIGRFLQQLQDLGLADDTVIAFTSDHGTHIGEQGYVQKTGAQLDSRVAQLPLIVRHPDRAFAGKRHDGLVSATDLMPGLLDVLEVEDAPEMDGESFWKLATGEADSIHDRVYSEFWGYGAVRDGRWHYYQPVAEEQAGGKACLYDLDEDPGESTNVAMDHPDVVKERQAYLAERFATELPEATID
jgi:arylsulfatase A-like enzyme